LPCSAHSGSGVPVSRGVAELLPGWPNRRRRGRAAGLIEILNTADQFCAGVESALQDAAPLSARDDQELRTKLGLCRNLMAYVRRLPNPGIDNPAARDGVKSLITAMLWVAYYARTSLKYKPYRKLVIAEAIFTHILMEEIPNYPRNGSASHPKA